MVSFRTALLCATAFFGLAGGASAQTVGSGNEAVIEPAPARPAGPGCVVPLVKGAKFDSATVTYSYTPPAACPGPWGAVVLELNIGLNKGRQYDRSGLLTMAGVPLWFGTTAEPRSTLAPHWTVKKDVTDYTALYKTAQTGTLLIANYYDTADTSTITANASLVFYPPTASFPAPVTADVVLPLPAAGGTVGLNSGSDQLSLSQTLPNNILRAVLDVYLQGQSGDEFWYTCVPNSLSTQLQSCGGGAFREGLVSVDGTPAGVAPVYPWIFTGGIDPYLWQPIPGVQTLDFTAFHSDLSPFAGVLSNGASHTVAVSVYGANGYFAATGALRLFLDKNAQTVTGSVTGNTLASAPSPSVVSNITGSGADASGTVNTYNKDDFSITGQVTGSAGTTVNTVAQTTVFHNNQTFGITDTAYAQRIGQSTDTTVTATSTTGGTVTTRRAQLSYPLSVVIKEFAGSNGNVSQATNIEQEYFDSAFSKSGTTVLSARDVQETVTSADTLLLSPAFSVISHSKQSETATYLRTGTKLPCYRSTLKASSDILSSATTSTGPYGASGC